MALELLGEPAPEVTLLDTEGKPFTIKAGQSGLPMVVFFFPTAGSYGCTREACSFRDARSESDVFKRTQCEIIGISGDTVATQKKFVDENGLNYTVLCDTEGIARKAYRVSKGMFGMTEGRTTFVIDSQGRICDVYDSVMNFFAHSKFVSKALEKLALQESQKTETD